MNNGSNGKNILLSVYTCDPNKGSESGTAYNWANNLALLGYDVTCLTTAKGRKSIEMHNNKPANLHFVYVELSPWIDKLYYRSKIGMYGHYLWWQWKAYRAARKIHRTRKFDLVHHISWTSLQLGSFMYKLKIPFVFGPIGGGQIAPKKFSSYFGKHWKTEKIRNLTSKLLVKFNPACYKTVRKANVVIAVNEDTYRLAKKLKASRIEMALDVTLSRSFVPTTRKSRLNGEADLKLLWVGRLMPRKGVFLVLEVMEKLDPALNISLTIVGDGELKNDLDAAIREKKLENVVRAVGSLPYDQVKNMYLSHDAFFFTSLRDSCPAQLIEAMLYGLPVITLDLHGQSIMVDKERGIKVSADDPERSIQELTAAISQLANDRPLLEKLSVNAFEYARQEAGEIKINRIVKMFYPILPAEEDREFFMIHLNNAKPLPV